MAAPDTEAVPSWILLPLADTVAAPVTEAAPGCTLIPLADTVAAPVTAAAPYLICESAENEAVENGAELNIVTYYAHSSVGGFGQVGLAGSVLRIVRMADLYVAKAVLHEFVKPLSSSWVQSLWSRIACAVRDTSNEPPGSVCVMFL